MIDTHFQPIKKPVAGIDIFCMDNKEMMHLNPNFRWLT
ncbi:hypothetical protein V473_06330 [Sphingobium cupriresistens LL01]|uniref:Uncharacterized protein n=1 Tax=Sphingobium cupriresistens LL01 TaxID=1420583 RepID=A0A0J7Y4A4_9SPHN|nr:hypothetical protein V473_06330 [Sphingobium cupriresistens LL01]